MSRDSWDFQGKEVQEAKKQRKQQLPEILDQEIPEANKAVLLLEKGAGLKLEMKEAEVELKEIQEELVMIQESNGLPGIRHGQITFVSRLQDGRKSLDQTKLRHELLDRGVDVEVIDDAIKAATKIGDAFWVKELTILKD